MIGFEVHPAKKWQAARAAFASLFTLLAIVVMIGTEANPSVIFSDKLALLIAGLVFLVFTLILLAQLYYILSIRFVLEFTETAIIDRRRRRARKIPFTLVEIFSPEPQELFSPELAIAEARAKLDIEEYISISCRLRNGTSADGNIDDFVFFERVRTPDFEMQKKIVDHLRSKISRFELLIHDDDIGFGDDETNS